MATVGNSRRYYVAISTHAILLQAITNIHEADRGSNHEFATARLLVRAQSERWRRTSSSYPEYNYHAW